MNGEDAVEELLGTLVDAWSRGMRQVGDDGLTRYERQFWVGLTSGLAASIAAVSGLPASGLKLSEAIRAGSDIAMSRLRQ